LGNEDLDMEIDSFFSEDSTYRHMNVRELNFLTDQSSILQALLKSKEDGTAIGLRSSALGPDTVITGVEDIVFAEGHTIVVLKHYDSSGYILPSHKVNLLEIQSICPFSTPFSNPYLQNFGKEKNWFF
jgi:hypothetical protein